MEEFNDYSDERDFGDDEGDDYGDDEDGYGRGGGRYDDRYQDPTALIAGGQTPVPPLHNGSSGSDATPGLYDRINRRVDQMLQNGLMEEARSLYPYREYNALNTVPSVFHVVHESFPMPAVQIARNYNTH